MKGPEEIASASRWKLCAWCTGNERKLERRAPRSDKPAAGKVKASEKGQY